MSSEIGSLWKLSITSCLILQPEAKLKTGLSPWSAVRGGKRGKQINFSIKFHSYCIYIFLPLSVDCTFSETSRIRWTTVLAAPVAFAEGALNLALTEARLKRCRVKRIAACRTSVATSKRVSSHRQPSIVYHGRARTLGALLRAGW